MEVFDKPAVKLLFQTRSYSNLSFLSCSTAQYPSPPPDLAIEREKLKVLKQLSLLRTCMCTFLRTCIHESWVWKGVSLSSCWYPYSSQKAWSQYQSLRLVRGTAKRFLLWHWAKAIRTGISIKELAMQLCGAHWANFEPHNTFQIITPLVEGER